MDAPLPERKAARGGLQSAILFAVRMNSRDGVVDVPAATRMLKLAAFDVELDDIESSRLVVEAAALLGVRVLPRTVGGRFARHL